MKTLPLGIAGLGTSSLLGSDTGHNDDGRDFSALLQSPAPPRQPLAPRPRTLPTPGTPRDAQQARGETAGTERDAPSRPRTDARPSRPDERGQEPNRAASAREDARTASPRRTTERAQDPQAPADGEAPGDTRPDTDSQAVDAPWPPAGLGGLENLLAAPQTVQPSPAGAIGTPPGDAQAAVVQATGARAPASPALQPGPAVAVPTPAHGATVAPGTGDFAATLANAVPELAPGKPDAVVAGQASGAQAPDAGTLFALHAPAGHAGVVRGEAAVFDGSPTPAPHLHEGFDDAIGTRLSWLADQKIGHAHIKIAPDDLGPVEVRLQLDGDKVQANFTSAHADVRQALEQSIPRLREMLGQHGFQLAHADVGGQQSQGRPADARGDALPHPDDIALDGVASIAIPAATLRQHGLLDAYA
ncbi:MAG: flagellar hook-length control protein FliK [Gammaproteobacteria bacterium]